MACSKCSFRENTFHPNYLMFNPDACVDCKQVFQKIEEIGPLSIRAYSYNLHGQILFSNYEDFKKIIADVVQRTGKTGQVFTEKDDILVSLSHFIGSLVVDLQNLLQKNLSVSTLSLLTILEYNTFLTSVHMMWFLHTYKKNIETDAAPDQLGKFLIEYLNQLKDINDELCRSTYLKIQSSIAHDKAAFQLAFKICSKLSNYSTNDDLFNTIDEGNIIQIIRISRAIQYLIDYLERIQDGIIELTTMNCDDSGFLHFLLNEQSKGEQMIYADNFIDSMGGDFVSGKPDNVSTQINKISRKYIGFSTEQLAKLSEKLFETYSNGDEYLVGSIEYFQELIQFLLQGSQIQSQKLIEHLTHIKGPTEFSWFVNRPLRRSLIPVYKNIIACPVNVFQYSIMGLYSDILSNEVDHPDFFKDLQKYKERIDNQFEQAVCLHLNILIPNAKAIWNVNSCQIPIVGTKNKLVLPGQVDVIMIHENKVFVIECKNFAYRLSSKQMLSELRKFRKEELKLGLKAEIIEKNVASIAAFMGLPTYISYEIVCIFVTKNYTFSTARGEGKYPIIPIDNLINWMDINL
ncbi:NERD domain-containing protein [Paenibacillus odorifer]|uniref:NERD domain-containing protein n=1 Tax=Paenibacillus odorifer TaxID=189426 RepID=A0AAD0P4Z7_9BACL|nr:NERD domain-containing protein [Paenibacillus odorifer]AWV34455.1 hypothetical protein CD191_18555 [Paenibacillus odorifer]